MKNFLVKGILAAGLLIFSATSCTDDLDRLPRYDFTSEVVYSDFNNYRSVLAKIYAGLSLTGQRGPDGRPDVLGIDEGASNYIRQFWQLQQVPTDETVLGWADAGLPELNMITWTPSNGFIRAMYNRIFFQITLANEFIRETSDARLGSRGITGANLTTAQLYRAEARFMRALSYLHALDLFGNVPFVTENDPVGVFFPRQISRAELFSYVESELLAVESLMVAPRQNEYGRADQAAAWTALAKLYLNAEVYTGQARYTDAANYAKRVIDAGYSLHPNYDHLFLTDNNTSPEIIFAVVSDGTRTQSYGATTFLVNASIGGTMNAADFGTSGGWAGLRTTRNLVNLFPDITGSTDTRANFFTNGQRLEINDLSTFQDGYAIMKYKNVSSAGQRGSDPAGTFVDTDFPLFRLADVYLMYAEAVLRGGSGDRGLALNYINLIRQRAYGNNSGNISNAQLTLNFILDERARELYWEAHRRTDLIRYGVFTADNYVWPFKGGVREGRGVADHYRLYPIPEADIIANPNLRQNDGYLR